MLSIVISLLSCSTFGMCLYKYMHTDIIWWAVGAGVAAFIFVDYWAVKLGGADALGEVIEGIGDILS